MKLKALPFVLGTWIYHFMFGGFDFAIACTIIFTILVITKTVDFI
jgi:hypothetical protein